MYFSLEKKIIHTSIVKPAKNKNKPHIHRHRGRYTEFRFTCREHLQLINLSQTTLWKGTCPLRGTGTRSSRSEDPGLASPHSDQTKSSSCKFEVFCHVTDPNMTSLSHILHSTVQYGTVCSFTSNCSYYFFRKLLLCQFLPYWTPSLL